LRSADCGTLLVVEQLALRLSSASFAAVLETLDRRTSSGTVANDAGLLVKLLKVALREQARLAAEAQIEAAANAPPEIGPVERMKRDEPERYIANLRGVRGFDLEGYLAEYVADEAERERLRGIAA